MFGQKWQNHNFGDKTVFKYLSSLDFSLHVIAGFIKPRIQSNKFGFLRKRDFMPVWKFGVFENKPLILKIVMNTFTKRQQIQWKVKAYTAISFKIHLSRFSKQKSYPSCLFLFFVHKFKSSIKWFLSEEFRWSLCRLKNQSMKKVFHKFYWNLTNLTGDAAGKTYAFVYAKRQ